MVQKARILSFPATKPRFRTPAVREYFESLGLLGSNFPAFLRQSYSILILKLLLVIFFVMRG